MRQDARCGAVHQLLRNRALVYRLEKRAAVAPAVRQLDVNPGAQCERACLAGRVGHRMQRLKEGDREVVGNDGAGEAKLLT